jgi:hypothetical protein
MEDNPYTAYKWLKTRFYGLHIAFTNETYYKLYSGARSSTPQYQFLKCKYETHRQNKIV